MMRRLLALIATLALAGVAAADDDCEWAASEPEVSGGGFYVDNDACQLDGCVASIWIYRESNGFDGLQRQDDVRDDTCGGKGQGDTLVASVWL